MSRQHYQNALSNLYTSHPSLFDNCDLDDIETIAEHFFEAGEESQLAEIGPVDVAEAAVEIARELASHD